MLCAVVCTCVQRFLRACACEKLIKLIIMVKTEKRPTLTRQPFIL